MAAEEALNDLETGVKCSATDTIDNAVSDSEFENSKQVADMAVDLKKLERKRNECIYLLCTASYITCLK